MFENEVLTVLTRIAEALERQVAQTDEQMERNRVQREENLQLHERERDAALAAAQAAQADLNEKLQRVLAVNAEILQSWRAREQPPSPEK
jgi:ABC-type phosphate transport system auxiliary subunit